MFYGYCNEAKYYCTWYLELNRIEFIEESLYISKQLDINMITAQGLDDMTLTPTEQPITEDPTVARNYEFATDVYSRKVEALISGTFPEYGRFGRFAFSSEKLHCKRGIRLVRQNF